MWNFPGIFINSTNRGAFEKWYKTYLETVYLPSLPKAGKPSSNLPKSFVAFIKEFLSQKNDPNTIIDCPQQKQKIPLLVYVLREYNNPAAAGLLIEAGADITVCDLGGYSALHVAAERGYLEIIPLLIHPITLNLNMEGTGTPLICALSEKRMKMANLLLAAKADITQCNSYGITALHYAVKFGFRNLLPLLISPSTIEAVDSNEDTPLMVAFAEKDVKCIQSFPIG